MSGKLDDMITAEVITLTNNNSFNVLDGPQYNMYSSQQMYPDLSELATFTSLPGAPEQVVNYKYAEDKIVKDFSEYLKATYSEHYMSQDSKIECFDAWIALGDSMPTFRNTAIKYLWRYGKKGGSNKKDLMKALHYTLMCLYVDHYKKGE